MKIVNKITQAIEAEIKERHARNLGRPDRELTEHLLIGLQRERVAAVGFDVGRLSDRLRRTQLSNDAQQLIAQAVGQIWLDENMHARYLLGVLLRQKHLQVLLGAIAENIEGGVGGWLTSIIQNITFSEAPLEYSTATLLKWGGQLSFRIPEEVQPSLSGGPFIDWCKFSFDAEQSAVLSFDRMITLCSEVEHMGSYSELILPEGFLKELERMRQDETMHAQVFQTISALIDQKDSFLPNVNDSTLKEALASIGGWQVGVNLSLSEDLPTDSTHPVGRGGLVVVARGATEEDKIKTFRYALERSGMLQNIVRYSQNKSASKLSIAIKIDLMLAYNKQDQSVYTDPTLVEYLVDYLLENGYRNISVCDAQNIYSLYFTNRTVAQVGAYVGLNPGLYQLVDLSLDQIPFHYTKGMGVNHVSATWANADIRISFAKLKTHPMAVGQLATRNAGGVVPQKGDYFFSDRTSEFGTVTMGLLYDFPVHFGIVDGYSHAADGLIGVLADLTPKHPKIIVAGGDILSVDYVTMRLMGERDPSRAPDLQTAFKWFGDPRAKAKVLGDLTPIVDWQKADSSLLTASLASLAAPVYSSFSMKGALFVPEMDSAVFHPINNSPPLSITRTLIRNLLLKI